MTYLKRMEEQCNNLLFYIMLLMGVLLAIMSGLYMGSPENTMPRTVVEFMLYPAFILGVFGGVVMGCSLLISIIRNKRGDYD